MRRGDFSGFMAVNFISLVFSNKINSSFCRKHAWFGNNMGNFNKQVKILVGLNSLPLIQLL